MRLNEIIGEKDEGKDPDGTYVGMKVSKETRDNIWNMTKSLEVPNPLDKKDYHVTVIFSRKYLPTFSAKGKLKEPLIGKPEKFEIFPARNDKNCLVLRFSCPELNKRHHYIMNTYDAKYDFDQYKPHITLSYDVGDFDPSGIDPSTYIDEIELTEEYDEELQLDWLANKNDK